MLVSLCILLCCVTQVATNTPNGKGETRVTTCEGSQTTPKCDQCINPGVCKNWFYTSPVFGPQVFEFCREVTEQMQCLFDKQDNNDKLEKRIKAMETELQICIGNIELITINNQTTIANLQFLNVSMLNISYRLDMIKSKQDLQENELTSNVNRLDNIDVKLKELSLDLNSSKPFMSNITAQLKNLEIKTKTIQVEQNSHIDTLRKSESSLRTEIQNVNAHMRVDLVNSISNSESKLKHTITVLKEETDKNINKIKSDQSETDSQQHAMILELSENIIRLRENSTAEVKATKVLLEREVQSLQSDFEGEKSHLKIVEMNLKTEFNGSIAGVVYNWEQELNNKMLEIENKLEEIKTNMSKETQLVQQKTDSIERNIETIQSELQIQIDKMKQELQSSIDKQRSALEEILEDISQTLNKEIQAINNKLDINKSDFEAKLNDQEKHFQNADKSLQDNIEENALKIETETNKIRSEIHAETNSLKEDINTRIVHEVEQLAKQTKEVNQTVTKQKEMVDIIFPNTFNKEMFQMAFLFLVVLVLINFAIVYCLVKNSHHLTYMYQSAVARNSIMGNSNVPHSPTEVVNRFHFSSMPNPVSLELCNAITVVSFYEDAQKHHRRLVESIVFPEEVSTQLRIDYHVVRRHEDIPCMPSSKLYLMFVEFSERHVIIEEPGLGLGDLKRKTAEAITNKGACLVIVYVKDPGSRRLPENKLFNDGIYCVTSQPELKVLHKHDRFLSIYDKFTEFQRERLAQIIEANIDVPDVHSTPKRMSKSMHSLH